MLYFWIALGSALGGVARFWCYSVITRMVGETFPWGTLLVNVLGCTFIGLFASLTGPGGRLLSLAPSRVFVMTGFCGGYTTFSTFSIETLNLARHDQWAKAAGNAGASLVFCLAGVWLGHTIAASLNQR